MTTYREAVEAHYEACCERLRRQRLWDLAIIESPEKVRELMLAYFDADDLARQAEATMAEIRRTYLTSPVELTYCIGYGEGPSCGPSLEPPGPRARPARIVGGW